MAGSSPLTARIRQAVNVRHDVKRIPVQAAGVPALLIGEEYDDGSDVPGRGSRRLIGTGLLRRVDEDTPHGQRLELLRRELDGFPSLRRDVATEVRE